MKRVNENIYEGLPKELIPQDEAEIWLPISGYEGTYEISSFGRVRSIDRIVVRNRRGTVFSNGIYLNQYKDKGGYLVVHLWKASTKKSILVHRLVGAAFLINEFNKRCINHKNGIKTDNHVGNLEYVTHSENNRHKYRVLKSKHPSIDRNPPKTARPVVCIDTGEQYKSLLDAAKKTGLHRQCISENCRGKLKRTGKLTFKFKNDD